MEDKIVGIMWNRNEGDILDFTITKALKSVDYLLLADDHSSDRSPEVMQLWRSHPKVQEVILKPAGEKKQILLDLVRQLHDPFHTLVQVIESDITILETDIREAWAKYNNNNASMSWHLINATDPDMWQSEEGCFPNWEVPIHEKMSNGHWMEALSHYTFRPLPGVHFENDSRPWPRGLAQYVGQDNMRTFSDAPLLAHWGYRGPTHWFHKYSKGPGSVHPKHKWPIGSVSECKQHVPFFNGIWNVKRDQFHLSRDGWKHFIKEKWGRN